MAAFAVLKAYQVCASRITTTLSVAVALLRLRQHLRERDWHGLAAAHPGVEYGGTALSVMALQAVFLMAGTFFFVRLDRKMLRGRA